MTGITKLLFTYDWWSHATEGPSRQLRSAPTIIWLLCVFRNIAFITMDIEAYLGAINSNCAYMQLVQCKPLTSHSFQMYVWKCNHCILEFHRLWQYGILYIHAFVIKVVQIIIHVLILSSRSDTYVQTTTFLVQIMDCCLFGGKRVTKPIMTYCQFDHSEHISLIFVTKLNLYRWQNH